jgi:hypothetical protein
MTYRTLILLVAALALAPAVSGCAALTKIAATVVKVIAKYGPLLDAIDSQAQAHFAKNPDPDVEEKYNHAMAKAKLALAALDEGAKGTAAATQQDLDTAFGHFQKMYSAVLGILGPLGVVAPSTDGTMSAPADGGPMTVPAPEALSL